MFALTETRQTEILGIGKPGYHENMRGTAIRSD
jgi:hypothetical protein